MSRHKERRFEGFELSPLMESDAGKWVRIWPLTVFLLVGGLALVIRLFQLTVVEGNWRRQLAENNRIFVLPIAANRGVLTDRHGEALTHNVPVYRRQTPGTSPAALSFETIDREQALSLLPDPAERISYSIRREYPCGVVCAPLLGYVGEAGREELATSDYMMGDMVGRLGAERVYERQLKGIAGEEYVEVNARGLAVRTVGLKESQSGSTITLSIDLGLQQVLYEALGDHSGAAVAMDPGTGEVLALVSKPTFDPHDISASLSQANQPFFNRALSGTYAPGSTFKMVTATAALEDGKINAASTFQDTGELVVGDFRFGNWLFDEHGRTEGEVDVIRALSRSNDIFFYQIGGLVGPESMAEWARSFGYGTNWNLSGWGASNGLVPDPAWKLTAKKERWYLGNTYHMSIGQGDVLATPLQVAVMTAAIARGGVVCPPRFEKATDTTVSSCQQLNLNETTIQLVQEGMKQACQPGGTGSPFFSFSPQVSCKTGTAQQGGEEALPHAWFTLYAPADNPEIVVTVLVEAGGQGSQVAAPVAKKALEYWFEK
jgi:penicillin-binding protein 2